MLFNINILTIHQDYYITSYTHETHETHTLNTFSTRNMSNTSRKRAFSTAFERPATPSAHQTKAVRTLSVSALADELTINDENADPAGCSQDGNIPARESSLPPRGTPLQQLVEISYSDGQFRPKITLGDDDMMDDGGAWESTPFVIYEDPDVVMKRLALGGEE